ncbi:MAG TPA: glycogen debranching protein GlgX [Steroidobacteraceae bacterium]|nr:glycogen debranching protein GlgX [Steroidobacteraceae bacterium]
MEPIKVGQPRPLGAACSESGVNFAVFSSHATRVDICIFDAASGREKGRWQLPGRSGDVWHGLLPPRRAGYGSDYAFCVHGPEDAAKGYRFDARATVLDPYAHQLVPGPPLRCRIVDPRFDWHGDRAPAIPWRDTLLYELHVKGYTALHPAVPAALRGKYLGLAQAAVIEHLQALGVTAVELLPCQAFVSEPFLLDRGLVNYWGYNPAGWFAPAWQYAVEDPVAEFKTMVKALHAAGIEVIMDVVFNHTAEGNEAGPMLSLRGIDNPLYYRLLGGDPSRYENITGCGNTVNCGQPAVRSLIVDCLKYWVEEMHVDGFRFDLASVLGRDRGGFEENSPLFKAVRAEPALSYAKLIAEPWDLGVDGYQLGRFPPGWSEWNDRYRDAMRAFWRGDGGKIGDLAERLAGSSDLFRHNGRKPTASVNFLSAHDGFTLYDLVAYNERHNEANLENNTDGANDNLSWNCGAEGESEEHAVIALRARQMRNLLATLLLSQGVPMLQAGDEFARTQRGNNNAYCQDNELSWVDWRLRTVNADLLRMVQTLAALRRRHAEFRRETFFKGAPQRAGAKDVVWLHMRGTEMTPADWANPELRTLGVWLRSGAIAVGRLLLLISASGDAQEFALPTPPSGAPWRRLVDTVQQPFDAPWTAAASAYPLGARSVVLLEC